MAGWVGGGCFLTIRLSQPSLAGVRAGAELGNDYEIPYYIVDNIFKIFKKNHLQQKCFCW